jgi:lipopolysaccharide transport system ATP-binding protein
MSETVITVEDLSKSYLVGHETAQPERYKALRDEIAREARNFVRKASDLLHGRQIVQGDEVEEFWALKNVSFEVKKGEVLGIIGSNGAGKSTLLKILSRITEPSEGRATIRGRVASLLEVGTGFHPELSGRENIFLNGAILGMTRAEVRRKFDQIVAFAEVERFVDTPVKRFSSGMYVRLAFAIAAHLEPEILIVDEVLAVGDAKFQKACLGKMSEIAGDGRTILFVSHNMASIEALCPRSIHLATRVVQDGKTDQVVASYLDPRARRSLRAEAYVATIQSGSALQCVRVAPRSVRTGGAVNFEFVFLANTGGEIRECAVLIYSAKKVRVAVVDVRESSTFPIRFEKGSFEIRTQIAALPLVEGVYTLGLYLVTDRFAGDLLGIENFVVGAARAFNDFVPYHAENRGILALKAESTVKVHQTEVA